MDRPITPATEPARPAGTEGCSGANRATRPSASRVATSDTSRAASSWAAVPDTGIRSPSGEVVPGRSPEEDSHARVAAMVAGVGPKVEANWPGAR